MFLSRTDASMDAKGRVAVPADFRSMLGQAREEAVFVFPHFSGGYLEGGGYALMQEYQAEIENRPRLDPERRKLAHAILGRTKQLGFDANGRITLPAAFREHAGLKTGEKVVFVGLGSHFEIWNPQAYEAHAQEAGDFANSYFGGEAA
ncbi:MAG: division/cell wall cluster transcriptional repressor MraZ [Maricaulaceae bacterium]